MTQGAQERPKTTTVYAGLTWDDIVGAAALAAALGKKGYRVYVDLPSRDELSNLRIVRSYAVGIQPKSGAIFINSISMIYSRAKRMGYVFRYDESGRGEVLMKLNAVSSVSEVVREYLTTINIDIEIPQQLLDDVVAMNNGGVDRLSKVGRVVYGIHKLKGGDKNVRLLLYNYAYSSIVTKNLKLPQELLSLYSEYERSLRLVDEIVKEGRYMTIGSCKVAVISSKHDDELISKNIDYIRPFVHDVLARLCRQDSLAFAIYEERDGIHEVRACVKRPTSMIKLVNSIPRSIVSRLSISTTPTQVEIRFLDPREATLDGALSVVTQIISSLYKE